VLVAVLTPAAFCEGVIGQSGPCGANTSQAQVWQLASVLACPVSSAQRPVRPAMVCDWLVSGVSGSYSENMEVITGLGLFIFV